MNCRGLAAALVALGLGALAAPAAETVNLKVLYAGNPGSARAKDFTAFLEKHFAKVTATDLGKFAEADTKDYDVVVIDWTSIYPRNESGKIDNSLRKMSMPPAVRLSPDYARPTVLIGAAGGQVAGGLQLKINWL
jgi:hypothetical protein